MPALGAEFSTPAHLLILDPREGVGMAECPPFWPLHPGGFVGRLRGRHDERGGGTQCASRGLTHKELGAQEGAGEVC